MYSITEIEDAIITTLKASATLGGYCKKIASFQIEAGDLEEQIRLFALQMPCVLVVYSEGTYTQYPNKRQDREMIFTILVGAQSFRGGGEARRNSVGAYQILDDLRAELTGQRCGLTIEPLFPVSESGEINTDVFSAFSIKFRTKCTFTF